MLNNPAFVREIAPRYNIQGTKWAQALESMKKMEGQNSSALKKFDRNEISAQELADAFFDRKTAENVKMCEMINSKRGDLARLRAMLRGIEDKDVKKVMYAYVEKGAWKCA